jgi:hypothetical protein
VFVGVVLGLGLMLITSNLGRAQTPQPGTVPEGKIEQGTGLACNEAENVVRVIRAAHDLASANEEIKRQNEELGKAVCAFGGMAFVRGDKISEVRDADGTAFDVVRLTLVAIHVNGSWMPVAPLVIYTALDADRSPEKKA